MCAIERMPENKKQFLIGVGGEKNFSLLQIQGMGFRRQVVGPCASVTPDSLGPLLLGHLLVAQ